jgi:hypothetical protein
MARYPANPKPWAAKPYGPDPDAWEDAKDQCRKMLYAWAARDRSNTYSELTQNVTAIGWPEGAYTHHGRQVGYLPGQVSLQELVRHGGSAGLIRPGNRTR